MKNRNFFLSGIGLILGALIIFSSGCKKDDENPGSDPGPDAIDFNTELLKDADDNSYKTITVGTQTWMAENLKTTHLNDGTEISKVTESNAWTGLTTLGYCYLNNTESNDAQYGKLYNWYTVNTEKLCPTGWHVPTDAEWKTLTDYLAGNGYGYEGSGKDVAKSIASTIEWATDGTPGNIGNDPESNNITNFSASPSGYRGYDGQFAGSGTGAYFWSPSDDDTDSNAFYRSLSSARDSVMRNSYYKYCGFSVRCIKD